MKHIFYPSIPYERNEFADSDNHYNCPIVTSYPENIKNNIDAIVNGEVDFMHPFLSFASEDDLPIAWWKNLEKKFDISDQETSLPSMQHGKNLQHAVKICVEKGGSYQIPG